MTRLVPRPDWTPEDVAAAIWAVASSLSDQRYLQLNTPDRIEAFARLPAVLALFRPAEEPDPLGFSPERLAQGEADVAAGRVVELGDALQRIRDNPPSAGDRPGNPMPASAPVAPPQAEERADLPASEESSWAPVLVESRTPETESVMIHHAHRGQACVACELAALRSELAASQREVERLRAQVADLEFDVGRLLMERYARRPVKLREEIAELRSELSASQRDVAAIRAERDKVESSYRFMLQRAAAAENERDRLRAEWIKAAADAAPPPAGGTAG